MGLRRVGPEGSTAGGKEGRQSLPSSLMASTSRCWMSLAWDCWIEWALKLPGILHHRWLTSSSSLPLVKCECSCPQSLWYGQCARPWHHLLALCSGSPQPGWYEHRGPLLPWCFQWSLTHFDGGTSQSQRPASCVVHWWKTWSPTGDPGPCWPPYGVQPHPERELPC